MALQPCSLKKSYATWSEAEKARKKAGAARAYECPWCGNLHLTSRSEWDNTRFEGQRNFARNPKGKKRRKRR